MERCTAAVIFVNDRVELLWVFFPTDEVVGMFVKSKFATSSLPHLGVRILWHCGIFARNLTRFVVTMPDL